MKLNKLIIALAGALSVVLSAHAGSYTPSTVYCQDEQCSCLYNENTGTWSGSCQKAVGTGTTCSSGGTQDCTVVPCVLGPYQTVDCPG